MKISTIIPNYNTAKWLPATLESVLAQKGDFDCELIVIDDHSTDDSWKILERFTKMYPRQVYIYKNRDKGGNAARNFGFTKSTGDFIQWLDSDDQLLPGKFETQLKLFFENPTIDIVYSDWRWDFYKDGQLVEQIEKIKDHYKSFLRELVVDNWNPPHSYMLKRSIAEKLHELQAWNPKRKIAQDREYFTMAAIYKAKFAYVPGLFSVYNRWSSESVSAMDFNKRLELSLELEAFFIDEIEAQQWIAEKEKKKLIAFLKTDSLKACFYNKRLTIKKPVNFSEIQWKQIHYKMRAFIPIIWLWQSIKLLNCRK